MKNITIIIFVILICSCQQSVSYKQVSDNTMARHDKIIQMILDYNEKLTKIYRPNIKIVYMKDSDDFHKDTYLPNYNSEDIMYVYDVNYHKYLEQQGKFVLRGPLTIEQVEGELPERTDFADENYFNNYLYNWGKFIGQYKEGDELYYYNFIQRKTTPVTDDDGIYIIVHKNEVIDSFEKIK